MACFPNRLRHRIPRPHAHTHNGRVFNTQMPAADADSDDSGDESPNQGTIGGDAGDRYGIVEVMIQRGNARAIHYAAMRTRPSEITIAEMNRKCVRFLFDLQQQADARGYNILRPYQVDELVQATNSRTTRLIQSQN